MRQLPVHCLLSVLALGVLQGAESRPLSGGAELKTADAVIQRWIQAVGGETAMRKLTSRITIGKLEFIAQPLALEVRVDAKAPDKRVTAITLPGGAGEIVTGYDGRTPWRRLPGQPASELQGDEARSARDEADFWETIEFKRRYSKLELKGSAKVGTADCYIVEATGAQGKPDRIYFDKATGLILRRDGEGVTLNGKADTETYFEDYRVVDGVKLAFKIRRPVPSDAAFTFVTTEVRHTPTPPDEHFKMPETK